MFKYDVKNSENKKNLKISESSENMKNLKISEKFR